MNYSNNEIGDLPLPHLPTDATPPPPVRRPTDAEITFQIATIKGVAGGVAFGLAYSHFVLGWNPFEEEQGEREFRAEVEIISRVHHRHLVSLVGYCIADAQRLLVYEFVPNNTLEHHIHTRGLLVLDWSKRVKIAIGAARGLAYLHEDCHPVCILLDDVYEAQVADFGLAKLSNDITTHVSTHVMGTFGYMAPEYDSSGTAGSSDWMHLKEYEKESSCSWPQQYVIRAPESEN